MPMIERISRGVLDTRLRRYDCVGLEARIASSRAERRQNPIATVHGGVFDVFCTRPLARAQPDPCAQKLLRIDCVAVDPGFIMQMRAGGAAGRADRADHLADPDDVADLDVDLRQMAVAG